MKLPVLFFKGNATRGQVLMLAFILLILTLGLFVIKIVKQPNELRPGEEYGVQYRAPGEIEITQVGDTKRVTDNRQNYSVTVPSSWQIEKPETTTRDVTFYTENCKFVTGYINEEMKLDELIKNNESDHAYATVKEYRKENFTKDNYFGLHTILITEETGFVEIYYFQVGSKIFSAGLGAENADALCSQELLQLAESLELR